MEELSQYHMMVQHRPGTKHGNADSLSRKPDDLTFCSSYLAGIKPTDLPCGGCHYCVRADQQWGTFLRDVDEAVNLTNATPNAVSKVTMESEIVENNPSGQAVMTETTGLKVSGCQFKDSSGSALPFNPEQNCSETDADNQGYTAMLVDVGTEDSIGLSDAHFDIVREGKDQLVCVHALSTRQRQLQTNPHVGGLLSRT